MTDDTSTDERMSLAEAQRRWNDFVDAIGHELRTPLTAIIGFQELLQEGVYGELEEKTQNAVLRIGKSAQELLALLNGMVDLARPDEAPPQLDLDEVSVDSLVAEAVEIGRGLAPERGVDWSDEAERGLGTIRTDLRRLQRAIFLAILASVRATPGGSIRLSAVREGDDAVIRLRGVGFTHLPQPPLAQAVLEKPADGDHRSLLRICLAVDTIRLLDGDVVLDHADDTPTLRMTLRSVAEPVSNAEEDPPSSR